MTKTKKIINNTKLAKEVRLELQNEFQIAKDLNHLNIVKYIQFVETKNEKQKIEEFHIILEYVKGGNLKELIKKNVLLYDHEVIKDYAK